MPTLFKKGISITNTEEKLLLNDLVNIEEWISTLLSEKIARCKERFIAEWQMKLFNDPNVQSIPANIDDFVNMVCNRPDYKNRVEREKSTNSGL